MIQPDDLVQCASTASTVAFPRKHRIKVALVATQHGVRENRVRLINSFPGMGCICSCVSAEAALAIIPEDVPDVVLMDIFLPRKSGIECTARLKELLPNLKIVMFTAREEAELLFLALEAGADGYLLNRTSPADLSVAIRAVLRGGVPMSPRIGRLLIESFRVKAKLKNESLHLSMREAQILRLVSKGQSNGLIAQTLNLSPETVSSHLKRIYKRLRVKSRIEAMVRYLQFKPS